MTKQETIVKIEAACARVLKQVDFAGGTVMALNDVIARLTSVRDQVAAVASDGNQLGDADRSMLWTETWECERIIRSIYDGFPMVPAEDVAALVTTEGAESTATTGLVEMAAGELEKAAAEPRVDAIKRVATVKAMLLSWAALGETDPEGATVPVVRDVSKLAEIARNGEVRKAEASVAAEKAAAEPKAPDPIEKLEAVAKSAEKPAPAPTPAAPAPVSWGSDLGARLKK